GVPESPETCDPTEGGDGIGGSAGAGLGPGTAGSPTERRGVIAPGSAGSCGAKFGSGAPFIAYIAAMRRRSGLKGGGLTSNAEITRPQSGPRGRGRDSKS